MNSSVQVDLNHFIKHLVQALKPIAKAEDIDLLFTPSGKATLASVRPSILAGDLAHIIGKLVEFTPEQETITVSIEPVDGQKCRTCIQNTGITLVRNKEITNACKLNVHVDSLPGKGTRYEIEIDLYEPPPKLEPEISGPLTAANYIPEYYAEIRNRLRAHFMKSDNLVDTLSASNPRDAAFLKRINELIVANLENRQFDTNHLSEFMNMSRTQLFRRLKPIIRQSPGNYIRTVKLQKAKELFETTDLRISEVAYRTGFETASHFTKVFTKQYGVKPSLFCRNKRTASDGSAEKE